MNIKVSKYQEGLRLDRLLSAYLPSRSQAEKYLKKAFVKNHRGEVIDKASYKVKLGDTFILNFPNFLVEESLKPYDFFVPILFEDADLLIVDKPAGLVVHPSCGHRQDSLVNALIGEVDLRGGTDFLRPGIVHRLDRDVSGLMVLTKTQRAYESLLKQFQSRSIRRVYRGWVIGHLPDDCTNNWQKIESFIGRHPRDRKKFYSFSVDPLSPTSQNKTSPVAAKKAISFYRLVKSYGKYLHHLECCLKTGRTHQIRVHLSSLSLSLIGDSVYGSRLAFKKVLDKELKQKIKSLDHRIALYAAELKFFHPISDRELVFRLPEPADLRFFTSFNN